MELVSGIITTHNRSVDIVERALKSILSQTHTSIEVIVVDDSTPDFSERAEVEAMVMSYAHQNVRYIKNENCQGACASRNTGLYASNGNIVGFLDDDDEWLPKKVEMMLPLFNDPEVGLVHCAWRIMNDEDGSVIDAPKVYYKENVYHKLMEENNYIGSTSFPLLRKQYLIKIGGFDVLQQSAQDLDVWLRMALQYKVDYVSEPLMMYHIHAGDRITKSHTKRIKGWERIIEKNLDFLQNNPSVYYNRVYRLALVYAEDKRSSDAFKSFRKCISLRPLNLKRNMSLFARIVHKLNKR